MKSKFSIVIPARNEADLVPKTLPSYIALKPSEIILCLDNPAPQVLLESISNTAHFCGAEDMVKIIQIPKGGWGDQQMKARRTGFLKAENNRILTGDIDIVVNRNVYKALRLVSKDDVGLASLTKLRLPHNLVGVYRFFGENFLRLVVHKVSRFGATSFSGLYAFWKPFWLDAEPIDVAKKYSMVKRKMRDGQKLQLQDFVRSGEDSHMRDCMEKKHKVVYLPDIGATVLTDPIEDKPLIQYTKGVYFAVEKQRSSLVAFGRTILRAQPHYFVGHLMGRKIRRKTG